MAVLTAAVIFAGVLCFFDLFLSFAIIRRLRHDAAKGHEAPARPGISGLQAGRLIPPFEAVTSAGASLSVAVLAGRPAAFAFFAARCPSCRDHLGPFADYARGFPGGRDQVIAVIAGPAEEAGDIVAALTGRAQLVIEPDFGPVATAFSVQTFPTFVTLDPDGRIDSAAWEIGGLPLPQTA